jgi:peptidoglycan-associated lipoprotein
MNAKAPQMILRAALLSCAALLAAACAKPALRRDALVPVPAQAAAALDASRATEPDVRDRVMQRIPGIEAVYFNYNSAGLDEGGRAALTRNAQWLKEHEAVSVQVAGHCDPRGTVEYNLALGQRRAAAVRSYYVSLGVAPARLATISYGKEQLACSDDTEACYHQDRRADTLAAVAADLSRAPSRRSTRR